MTKGWYTSVDKGQPVSCPSGEWTTIERIEPGALSEGPSAISAEMYGTLPATKPKDIRTQWVRHGTDVTKRQGHVVGTLKAWASVTTVLESISEADLPMELQFYQNGGSAMSVTSDIVKVLAPAAYVAGRVEP